MAERRRSHRPRAFHVMVKPRGPVCNLRCEYCYYLQKDAYYPESEFRISDEVMEAFTQQYIAAQQIPEITFGWQGGEPTLMGLDFFRRAVAMQETYRRPGTRIQNALQTNGTTLNDDWCQFFHDHGFLIGVSLDGPQALHDAYRHDRAGKPTFERVMAGVDLLKKHDVAFNVLTTVHAANGPHPVDVYRFLRDEAGTQFIQFIPIVERVEGVGPEPDAEVTERSVTGPQYGDFLIGVFDEWVRHDVGQVFVQVFDVALAAWLGRPPGLCVFDETCGDALILEHNGDLYACDHFVAPPWNLGSIMEEPLADKVDSAQQRTFGQDKRDRLPTFCRQCPVRFVCNGGCPKNRIRRTPDGEPGLNYLCDGYRSFFTHIDHPMQLMARELQARRPPANVMHILAQEEIELERRFEKAGRNDPCPCGSGLKFKHCHGRTNRENRHSPS